jgi:hypothetical protein
MGKNVSPLLLFRHKFCIITKEKGEEWEDPPSPPPPEPVFVNIHGAQESITRINLSSVYVA